jgi:ParB/RepB/Spo0J family partition protein
MKVKVSDIISATKPLAKERIRKEYGDIEDLAASMQRVGQLQPIVVDKNLVLIAGGRRLAAAVHLSWPEIDATVLDEVDEVLRRDMELEENIKRKDLEWPEEVRAVRDLYVLRNEKAGVLEKYTMRDLSADVDRGLGRISFDIQLANALDEFPELAEEASRQSAWKRYVRAKEVQTRAELAKRSTDSDLEVKEPEPDNETRRVPRQQSDDPDPPPLHQPIKKAAWRGRGILYHADSLDVLRLFDAKSVDCIVTDPPFALGMFSEGDATGGSRLAKSAGHMYDDDPHAILDILDQIFFHAARILKEDGHAYVFFHMTRYEEIFQMLRKHFETCEETPLIWEKNTPGIGDPNLSWVYSYEPCFWINRGRHLVKPQAFNVLRYDTIPGAKKIHPTEKPAALLRHIISASCLPGEVVLDPFAGSGSTLVAASQVGCRFIGVEREEKFFRVTAERIAEELGALDEKKKEAGNAAPAGA